MKYKPQKKTRELLDWCLKRVKSVPYEVTARWLFYRLVEEVLKSKGMSTKQAKNQYKLFLAWTSRARKRFYNGWDPSTLVDDTRKSRLRGFGYLSESDWLKHFLKEECILDKYESQKYIVEIWFEAEAMMRQFDYLTGPYHLSLRPFKGDASIEYKWKIAEHLNFLQRYHKPIVILYFGDYDKKGLSIPKSAVKDIRQWTLVPFEFIRVGINREHIEKWGILEAFDKEGSYQWEALSENQAESLIVNSIEEYWSLAQVEKVKENEALATNRWKELIEKALSKTEDLE
jgi:hypothetical protein